MSQTTLHLHNTAEALNWLRQWGITCLTVDSRQVKALAADGVCFIAWPGAARDGRVFVEQSLKDGARACLVEADGVHAFAFADAKVAALTGLKARSAEIAHGFFGEPSAELDVVAVTGTNGKTSTSWWTAQALSALGRGCGVIGTLGVGQVGTGEVVPTGLTTPDPITLHATFRQFADQGLKAAAIEASSIGIEELRLHATHIAVAQFTNFTQDHLDYHSDMESYWAAKRSLFEWPGLKAAVLNLDDPMGRALQDHARIRGLDCWSYGLFGGVRLQATDIRYAVKGLVFDVIERDETLQAITVSATVRAPAIGTFNVLNLLAVLGALRALGVDLGDAARVCSDLLPVPGRMQIVSVPDPDSRLPMVVVDYAHTPDALDKALQALHPVVKARGGRLWCVFGCGGDRDPIKRPMMGAVAEQHADQVVLTSDNPRSESPAFILSQIMAGIARRGGVDVLEDRRAAIAHALIHADARDVILIAGKGHEATQEVAGIKTPFSDVDEACAALLRRLSAQSIAQSEPIAMMMTLGLAHELLPGSVLTGDPATPIARVHTDTRTIEAGDLFVALQGERFDANAFLHDAQAHGAAAVLCHAGLAASAYPVDLPRIEVADTKRALAQLATQWRAQFTLPVVAVTGSNGKTTVTQMVAAILDAQAPDGAALATRGNFNNDIGVPLTLLRLRPEHRLAVVELGMNHPGEIAGLAAMTQPTVALVNNAQREHLEFMHTVEAVAQENGTVLAALPAGGVAVFPLDDDYTAVWQSLAAQRKTVQFGWHAAGAAQEVLCTQAEWVDGAWQVQASTPWGALSYRLAIAGRHNVKNSLAAAACALAAGVSTQAVVQGLQAFVPVKGRCRALQITHSGLHATLVDDTYNANPDSMRAAIDEHGPRAAGRSTRRNSRF